MRTKKDITAILKQIRQRVSNLEINWHKGLNKFQLLVGTVLSARTKDANTEKAVKALFRLYKSPEDLAKAPISKIQKAIKPVGFYKTKAKYIKELSRILVQKYGGEVPGDRKKLLELPGVGPKVSAIVLAFGFHKPVIPVDTHVHRVSNRIGLVNTKSLEETERALMAVIPKSYWLELNELFVLFGQNVCLPRKPRCSECPISQYCDYYGNLQKL